MAAYLVSGTLVVQAKIEAETLEEAQQHLDAMLTGTASWQAWGDPSTTPHLLDWVTEYPIVTSTRAS